MRLTILITLGLFAFSVVGCAPAPPAQVTVQDPTSNVEPDETIAQDTEVVSGQPETEPSETPEPTPTSETPESASSELASTSGAKPSEPTKLVAGSEVSLSAVMKADWVQGAAPKSFEPGKIYIFECWSTMCGPCIAMIPHVNELHNKYYDKGLRIYGMSVYEDDKDEVVKFVKEKGDGMAYPVAFTGGRRAAFQKEWMTPAGAKGIPHAFIVRNGKLLESTLASRLTDELIESMLSGDEGAKQAAATITAAKVHAEKIRVLLSNIQSARRKKDTKTMTANIEKLKVVESDHFEIYTEELWVLMLDEQWPAAITALNEMPANWATSSFVSMNGMRAAMRKNHGYPADFEKALINTYEDYVFKNENPIGPNHFACLSILQWKIGDKQNATTTANKMLETIDNFSNGRESYKTPYVRFTKSVNEGTMPTFSDLQKWQREARNEAKGTN